MQEDQKQTRQERKAEKKANRKKKSVGREILEWMLTFAVAIVLALIIRTFVFEPVRVDGNSMLNTLHNNEYMIATKWDYLMGTPERFDVVICHYPDPMAMQDQEVAEDGTPVRRSGGLFNTEENFVKRVVGLPGETLEFRKGELYINDEHIPQNFDKTESQRDYGPVVVPEGHYFVVGDNRNNSHDSRYNDVGPLPGSMIKGHVRCVVFPLSAMRAIESPSLEETPEEAQQ